MLMLTTLYVVRLKHVDATTSHVVKDKYVDATTRRAVRENHTPHAVPSRQKRVGITTHVNTNSLQTKQLFAGSVDSQCTSQTSDVSCKGLNSLL